VGDVQVGTLMQLPAFQLTGTVVARPLFGQHLMFNFLDFEARGLVPGSRAVEGAQRVRLTVPPGQPAERLTVPNAYA
jgi:hypothetical protein